MKMRPPVLLFLLFALTMLIACVDGNLKDSDKFNNIAGHPSEEITLTGKLYKPDRCAGIKPYVIAGLQGSRVGGTLHL